MPQVNITIGIAGNSPNSQTAAPQKMTVPLGHGPQTITFSLAVGSGSPATSEVFFAQKAPEWGNISPITWKPVTTADVSFPPGFPDDRKAAFIANVQSAINGVVPATTVNPSVASATFNPSILEGGQAFQIDLPYTVNYWINVGGVSYGPNQFDPEVDITPGGSLPEVSA